MSSTSESAFRSQLSGFGWSRRQGPSGSNPDLSTSQRQSLFSKISSLIPSGGDRGYIRLPTDQNQPITQLPAANPQDENAGYFVLSRWEKFVAFAACILGALVCFMIAFMLLPVLVLKPRKFVVLWTLGSLLFLSSFAVLQGPVPYFWHLVSTPRLPFTFAYFGSLAVTLYFAVGLKSSILTVISGVLQLICLVWYLVSYFPGGITTLKFGSRILGRRVAQSVY